MTDRTDMCNLRRANCKQNIGEEKKKQEKHRNKIKEPLTLSPYPEEATDTKGGRSSRVFS